MPSGGSLRAFDQLRNHTGIFRKVALDHRQIEPRRIASFGSRSSRNSNDVRTRSSGDAPGSVAREVVRGDGHVVRRLPSRLGDGPPTLPMWSGTGNS
jgi:hypothetical protein